MVRIVQGNRILLVACILLISIFAACAPVSGAAYIDVTSSPSGATVCLDGWNCDTTPETFSVGAYTWHTVTVSMPGYQTWSDYMGTGSDVSTTAEYAQLVPVSTVGWLKINPFGADVTVDGTYYGNGDMSFPLSAGSHTLQLKKAGYSDYTTTFSISDGQTTSLAPGMTPYAQSSGYGDLQIQSDPSGAAVYVNNNYKGTTSSSSALYVTQLTPGSYTVSLSLPDYQTYTETAVVQSGIIYDIHANLVPVTPGPSPDTTGQINVGSSPAGAEIYLDNTFRGITPMTLVNIPQGSHTIILKITGYQDWSSPVNVIAGTYAQVSGTLSSGQQPNPTATAPQPTKSPAAFATIISAIGICGVLVLLGGKRV